MACLVCKHYVTWQCL